MKIPFNKPYLSGKETQYITDAAVSGRISGNGPFTQKCHDFFEQRFDFKKVLLTTSCTDALEMAALLSGIEAGDEVILPSYTFVSTATAFALRGAKLIFADVEPNYPNIDIDHIEQLITPKTKVIIVVHYCGVAVQMDRVMELSKKHNLFVVEDAAHAIDSYYKGKALGSFGHVATFSFHETKNIISGEGGLLVINDDDLIKRAEILWEKGTNRVAFSRGEVDEYCWKDLGSSYLASDLTAAFLYAQLENLDKIQERRKAVWNSYFNQLSDLHNKEIISLPEIPDYAMQNGNFFFFDVQNQNTRDRLLKHLANDGYQAVFHYLPLHSSDYFKDKYQGKLLNHTLRFSQTIVRLPFYVELSLADIKKICKSVKSFFNH
ncbi:MAG: dTDP-4-amino-4,6-dideoxygalactose transaminase [Bacteroidales bacterium]|nr:dTDP-4-amino-4,6-dideoxygalactose transaminase [Bacteroidales bacterium]